MKGFGSSTPDFGSRLTADSGNESPELKAARINVERMISDASVQEYKFGFDQVVVDDPNNPGKTITHSVRKVVTKGSRVQINIKGAGAVSGYFLGWDEEKKYLKTTWVDPASTSGDLNVTTTYIMDIHSIRKTQ